MIRQWFIAIFGEDVDSLLKKKKQLEQFFISDENEKIQFQLMRKIVYARYRLELTNQYPFIIILDPPDNERDLKLISTYLNEKFYPTQVIAVQTDEKRKIREFTYYRKIHGYRHKFLTVVYEKNFHRLMEQRIQKLPQWREQMELLAEERHQEERLREERLSEKGLQRRSKRKCLKKSVNGR